MTAHRGIHIPAFDPMRIMSKITIDNETKCWIWKASLYASGYGQIKIKGKSYPAHRASYSQFIGEIPPFHHIDHLCRVRKCVNPEHLEPVTPAENVRRACLARNALHGNACRHGHVGAFGKDSRGHRYCLRCHRASVVKYKKSIKSKKGKLPT